MVKIYGLIGSNKKNGTCYSLVIELIKLIERIFSIKGIEVIYKIDYVCDFNIKECKGCCNCFKNGKCMINDDMANIKKNILESDLLIIASPVYLNQITGTLKKVLDRIAYWTHLMPLIGKRGIIITNSSFSGNKESTDYLELILNHLGVSVDYVFKYKGNGLNKNQQHYNKKELLVYSNIFQNLDFKIDKRVTQIFDTYSKWYSQLIKENVDIDSNNELIFWNKNYLGKSIDVVHKKNIQNLKKRYKKNEYKK